jgi:hypothetical protein
MSRRIEWNHLEAKAATNDDINGMWLDTSKRPESDIIQALIVRVREDEAKLADLISALSLAADTFRSYATKHFLKMTPEGDEKAHENLKMAEQMEAAIAKAEPKS